MSTHRHCCAQAGALTRLGPRGCSESQTRLARCNTQVTTPQMVRSESSEDLANQLAVYQHHDPARLRFLETLHSCDVLVLDDFLTTPITSETAAELLNILAAREGRGSTVVTSQFDPQDWYKSLHDAVIAESILNRIVSNAELVQLGGPNMRRHLADDTAN